MPFQAMPAAIAILTVTVSISVLAIGFGIWSVIVQRKKQPFDRVSDRDDDGDEESQRDTTTSTSRSPPVRDQIIVVGAEAPAPVEPKYTENSSYSSSDLVTIPLSQAQKQKDDRPWYQKSGKVLRGKASTDSFVTVKMEAERLSRASMMNVMTPIAGTPTTPMQQEQQKRRDSGSVSTPKSVSFDVENLPRWI